MHVMKAELERVAAQSHHVFRAQDAFDLGLHRSWLSYRSGDGRDYRLVAPDVYEVVGAPPDPLRAIAAACLWAGGDGLASHRSAGAVLGFDGLALPPPVDVTLRSGVACPVEGWNIYRSRRRFEVLHERSDGIVATSAFRTLVDLASLLDADEWERALESALRCGQVDLLELTRWTERPRRGLTGINLIREVLAGRPPGAPATESELETRYHQLLRSSTLPMLQRQYVVRRPDGSFVARLDGAWPDIRLYIELDGAGVHGLPGAVFNDRARQNDLTALGWGPLRFTWSDVVDRPRLTIRQTERTHREWSAGHRLLLVPLGTSYSK